MQAEFNVVIDSENESFSSGYASVVGSPDASIVEIPNHGKSLLFKWNNIVVSFYLKSRKW